MMDRISVLGLILLVSNAGCGNYLKCPMNPCENKGQCIVMSQSPSSFVLNSNKIQTQAFFHSPEAMDWYQSKSFCQTNRASLFDPEKTSFNMEGAQKYMQIGNLDVPEQVDGYWLANLIDMKCEVIFKDTFELALVPCTLEGFFVPLCIQERTPTQDDTKENEFIYTCQCRNNFGYQNCTEMTSGSGGSAGKTFCQVEKTDTSESIISLNVGTSDKVIIIDHVAYGRPFFMEQSLTGAAAFACREDDYAQNERDFCVASQSLAAMIYWCQGKTSCEVNTTLFRESSIYKEYFLVKQLSSSVEDAEDSCQNHAGTLANPYDFQDIEKIDHAMFNSPVWLDVRAFSSLKASHQSEQCLLLGPEELVQTPCQGHEAGYPVLCEASFGFQAIDSRSKKSKVNPEDVTCLKSLGQRIVEYRYHPEDNFDKKSVSCPMAVDYRRGDTCYKKTGLMSWKEARRQCWKWGGDLAFILSNMTNAEECMQPTFIADKEELWMASSEECPTGGTRCPIQFSDMVFEEGVYDLSNDICFPDIDTDLGCDSNSKSCEKLRKGLCALAPTNQPRSFLPMQQNCEPVQSGTPGWPYPNYNWTIEGAPGQTTGQVCPEGQDGLAFWQCGQEGDWIGLPDMSNCTRLEIEDVLNNLEDETSVPSDVIGNFYNNVSSGEELASGDVNKVLTVLDKAIKVQADRIEAQEDPEAYADSFTEQGVNLLDDVLRRQTVWLGLEDKQKRQSLTTIQDNLDEITQSIMKYSKSKHHLYSPVSKAVEVKISREIKLSEGDSYSSGQSKITVSGRNDEEISISFHSFPTFGCILNAQEDCFAIKSVDDTDEVIAKDLVNSVVLGATLYQDDQRIKIEDQFLEVNLTFSYNFQGDKYNLSKPMCGYWNGSGWSEDGCELVESGSQFSVCYCNHLTNFGVILDINGNLEGQLILNYVLTWITIVGCSASIISLVICIVVFLTVPGLRGERTTIHLNLCFCLLFAEILLLSGLDATSNPGVCGTIAGFLHFLFLAAFAWMFVEGVHVYFMLVKVFTLEKSPVWIYYLVGYGTPAIIVILSVIIVEATGSHGYGTDKNCWLDHRNGLIWAFAGPVIVILVANTAMFVKAMLIAYRSLSSRSTLAPAVAANGGGISKLNRKNLTLAKGSFSLLCILGLTWICGFFYFANGAEWLSVVFALLNSFQGVFILIFHVILNDKARKDVSSHYQSTFASVSGLVNLDKLDRTFKNYSVSEASQANAKAFKQHRQKRRHSKVISMTDITESSFIRNSQTSSSAAIEVGPVEGGSSSQEGREGTTNSGTKLSDEKLSQFKGGETTITV
ncbi:adhesion G protein-coupled receptor L2-like isoform X2 [Tigriopus californicus]|uniref:adhesion G protein-coupled receptor L2-like isoform X2 n=1 Tax=Tigriopus californicus TaxID=6832 RepID=UPI0027DA1297|nr:adhesion G protein-coupled receptor L2-like isoform X2 [Tigriopus californicus]